MEVTSVVSGQDFGENDRRNRRRPLAAPAPEKLGLLRGLASAEGGRAAAVEHKCHALRRRGETSRRSGEDPIRPALRFVVLLCRRRGRAPPRACALDATEGFGASVPLVRADSARPDEVGSAVALAVDDRSI